MTDGKNLFIAIALSMIVLFGWQYFFVSPQMEAQQQALQQQQQAASVGQTQPGAAGDSPPAPTADGGAAVPAQPLTREEALARSPRVVIDTPSITGSINLRGGRLDDVRLKKYRETVDPSSPLIVLYSPAGSPDPYYAEFGVVGAAGGPALPDANTVWEVESGERLTPTTPVVLRTESEGVVFRRTYAIDADYMLTVEQSVENTGSVPVTLYPYGRIARFGTPATAGYFVLHEGLLGVFGDRGLTEIKYHDLVEDGPVKPDRVSEGWLGITDKYWASTLVPVGGTVFQPSFTYAPAEGGRREHFQADFLRDAVVIAPGATAATTDRLFAGAKEVSIVDGYRTSLDIRNFDLLIDWGWFYFITKPMFFVIDYIFSWVGNFGVAILLVTVLIKALFFPLANKSYVSMSRMKLVQPQMTEIRERYKEDKTKQQQALMELYKKEKINPVAGCLPILIQIPVFFALYKVLFVTIEMRHAPFFGWIHDLAAPDPTTLFNLFGLIPWTPPHFLMIGVWPLIMGVTMFVQMKLNPTPPDPTQAMVFTYMPIIFTFMLASFPAGLVIYWAWNNTLSVLQQAVIMKRQGVKIELWDNLRSTFRRKPKSAT